MDDERYYRPFLFLYSDDYRLKAMYLDYVNNFLTVSAFASAYFVTEDEARSLIKIGKRLYEQSYE